MNDPIPKSSYSIPLYFWISNFKIRINSSCSFTYYFKIPNYCIYGLVILNKSLEILIFVYFFILTAESSISSNSNNNLD